MTPDRRVGVWHHLAIQFVHHCQSGLEEGVSFWRRGSASGGCWDLLSQDIEKIDIVFSIQE